METFMLNHDPLQRIVSKSSL